MQFLRLRLHLQDLLTLHRHHFETSRITLFRKTEAMIGVIAQSVWMPMVIHLTIEWTSEAAPGEALLEVAVEVISGVIGGMTVTVTVTWTEREIGTLHTEGDEVGPEVLQIDMRVDETLDRTVPQGGFPHLQCLEDIDTRPT
jgi:hypothetical protein